MNEQRWRTQRETCLVSIYLLFVVYAGASAGVVGLTSGDRRADLLGRIDLLLAIPMSLCCVSLCTVDAKLVGKPLRQLAKLGIFLGWPIGVPIYLLWTRGIRGLGLFLLHGFLILLVALGMVVVVVCALSESFLV